MRVLLISTYELGHQPLGLASPAAALRQAGHDVFCLDLDVQQADASLFADAEVIGFSVPMHTAARLAVETARMARRLNPDARIVFYGLYATPLHDLLVASGAADYIVGGEYETGLAALCDRLSTGRNGSDPPGVGQTPSFERGFHPLPDRRGLPMLDEYARLRVEGELRLAGYVEASRGCAHVCRHCPLTPVYGGRLRLVRPETVLADISQLIELGARHITFGDPDFLNAVPHSMAIAREMRRRHAEVTFDATVKVEHLLEHASLLAELRDLGCLFVTSAFESMNDETLRLLAKGHTRSDLQAVVRLAAREGIALRPTWLAFTPWTALRDFVEMLAFVEEEGLVNNVQPVQYALRLLLPPGSPLIDVARRDGLLAGFDEERLTYDWRNPDSSVERLQSELAEIVERSVAGEGHVCAAEPYESTFARVKQAALGALSGRDVQVDVLPQPRKAVPGLTEPWFC